MHAVVVVDACMLQRGWMHAVVVVAACCNGSGNQYIIFTMQPPNTAPALPGLPTDLQLRSFCSTKTTSSVADTVGDTDLIVSDVVMFLVVVLSLT